MGTSNEEALEIKNATSPRVTTRALFTKKSFTVSSKKPKKKEVWSYTKRKRFRKFGRYSLPSVKSQLNKRFLVKKSAEKDSESSHSKPLQVDVTEPEETKSTSKSPPILAQMSPSRPVKVLSPRRLSDVSDKKSTSEKISDLPIKTANPQTTAMEVDSGISSSVDSNGDSLDSVEQAKQLEKQKVLAMEEEEENSTVKEPPVLVPESEPVTGVVVSRERLEQLLERVVTHTEGLNVERLQKLYSVFSQCIVRHRNNNSKVDLIQELQTLTENSCTNKTRSRSDETVLP